MFKKRKLKHLRKEFDYSLDKVAELASMSKSYLWELENKELNPSGKTIYKLSLVFGVPMEYFYDEELKIDEEIVFAKCLFNKAKQLIREARK